MNALRHPHRIAATMMTTVVALAIFLLPVATRAGVYDDFNRAVLNNDVQSVTRLIARGADPDTANEKGEPALLLAAREGTTDLVRALVKGRANVNIRSPHGDTPIMLASLAGNLATVKVLREAGAQINHSGWTPLQYAAFNGHNAIVEYLIAAGADLGLAAPNGLTPVMLAVLGNRTDTLKLLVSSGFDVDARNEKGESALDIARSKGFTDIEKILRGARR